MDFLVETTIDRARFERDVQDRASILAAEADRAGVLASKGTLLRLWRPADRRDEWCNLGLWRAPAEAELVEALASLPLATWMSWQVRELTDHPNDPRATAPNSGRNP